MAKDLRTEKKEVMLPRFFPGASLPPALAADRRWHRRHRSREEGRPMDRRLSCHAHFYYAYSARPQSLCPGRVRDHGYSRSLLGTARPETPTSCSGSRPPDSDNCTIRESQLEGSCADLGCISLQLVGFDGLQHRESYLATHRPAAHGREERALNITEYIILKHDKQSR